MPAAMHIEALGLSMLGVKSELNLNTRIENESYNSVFYNPNPGLQPNAF